MGMEEDALNSLLLSGSMWEEKPIKHYSQVIPVTIHHFYLSGEIEEEVDRYFDMLNILKTAEPHDKIFIYINSPGGSLTTTMQIVSSMSKCPSEVTTVLEGEACSGATFIFLTGDTYVVNDNCQFMVHNYSHGTYGKGAEVNSHVDFSRKYFGELVQHFYKNFLTDKEIEQLCDDKDFWMSSNELTKRLRKRGDGRIIDFAPFEVEEETPKPKPRKRGNKKKAK